MRKAVRTVKDMKSRQRRSQASVSKHITLTCASANYSYSELQFGPALPQDSSNTNLFSVECHLSLLLDLIWFVRNIVEHASCLPNFLQISIDNLPSVGEGLNGRKVSRLVENIGAAFKYLPPFSWFAIPSDWAKGWVRPIDLTQGCGSALTVAR